MIIRDNDLDGWNGWIIGRQGGNQIRFGYGKDGWYFVVRIFNHLFMRSGEWSK